MFSLIVTVIAIALVIVLAIASIYYGSGTYKEKQATIAAQAITNQAQQIYGAAILYAQENAGNWPASTQVLLDNHYINAIPVPPPNSYAFGNEGYSFKSASADTLTPQYTINTNVHAVLLPGVIAPMTCSAVVVNYMGNNQVQLANGQLVTISKATAASEQISLDSIKPTYQPNSEDFIQCYGVVNNFTYVYSRGDVAFMCSDPTFAGNNPDLCPTIVADPCLDPAFVAANPDAGCTLPAGDCTDLTWRANHPQVCSSISLSISLANAEIGNVNVGSTGTGDMVLTNNLTTDTQLIGLTGSGSNDFTILSTTCGFDIAQSTFSPPVILAGGASCSITVQYAPQTAGASSKTFTVSTATDGNALGSANGIGQGSSLFTLRQDPSIFMSAFIGDYVLGNATAWVTGSDPVVGPELFYTDWMANNLGIPPVFPVSDIQNIQITGSPDFYLLTSWTPQWGAWWTGDPLNPASAQDFTNFACGTGNKDFFTPDGGGNVGCFFTVLFNPQSAGPQSATISYTYKGVAHSIPVSGIGADPNVPYTITPTVLNYDFTQAEVSARQFKVNSVVVTSFTPTYNILVDICPNNLALNSGSVTSNLLDIDNNVPYPLSQVDACSKVCNIYIGESCTFEMAVTPNLYGFDKVDTNVPLEVTVRTWSDVLSAYTPTIVPVYFNASTPPAPPALVANPASLDLYAIPSGWDTKTVTISNNSATPVSVGQVEFALIGATTVNPFSFVSNTCANTVINVSGSCSIEVMFEPIDLADATVSINVAYLKPDNSNSQLAVPVTGHTVDPNTLVWSLVTAYNPNPIPNFYALAGDFVTQDVYVQPIAKDPAGHVINFLPAIVPTWSEITAISSTGSPAFNISTVDSLDPSWANSCSNTDPTANWQDSGNCFIRVKYSGSGAAVDNPDVADLTASFRGFNMAEPLKGQASNGLVITLNKSNFKAPPNTYWQNMLLYDRIALGYFNNPDWFADRINYIPVTFSILNTTGTPVTFSDIHLSTVSTPLSGSEYSLAATPNFNLFYNSFTSACATLSGAQSCEGSFGLAYPQYFIGGSGIETSSSVSFNLSISSNLTQTFNAPASAIVTAVDPFIASVAIVNGGAKQVSNMPWSSGESGDFTVTYTNQTDVANPYFTQYYNNTNDFFITSQYSCLECGVGIWNDLGLNIMTPVTNPSSPISFPVSLFVSDVNSSDALGNNCFNIKPAGSPNDSCTLRYSFASSSGGLTSYSYGTYANWNAMFYDFNNVRHLDPFTQQTFSDTIKLFRGYTPGNSTIYTYSVVSEVPKIAALNPVNIPDSFYIANSFVQGYDGVTKGDSVEICPDTSDPNWNSFNLINANEVSLASTKSDGLKSTGALDNYRYGAGANSCIKLKNSALGSLVLAHGNTLDAKLLDSPISIEAVSFDTNTIWRGQITTSESKGTVTVDNYCPNYGTEAFANYVSGNFFDWNYWPSGRLSYTPDYVPTNAGFVTDVHADLSTGNNNCYPFKSNAVLVYNLPYLIGNYDTYNGTTVLNTCGGSGYMPFENNIGWLYYPSLPEYGPAYFPMNLGGNAFDGKNTYADPYKGKRDSSSNVQYPTTVLGIPSTGLHTYQMTPVPQANWVATDYFKRPLSITANPNGGVCNPAGNIAPITTPDTITLTPWSNSGGTLVANTSYASGYAATKDRVILSEGAYSTVKIDVTNNSSEARYFVIGPDRQDWILNNGFTSTYLSTTCPGFTTGTQTVSGKVMTSVGGTIPASTTCEIRFSRTANVYNAFSELWTAESYVGYPSSNKWTETFLGGDWVVNHQFFTVSIAGSALTPPVSPNLFASNKVYYLRGSVGGLYGEVGMITESSSGTVSTFKNGVDAWTSNLPYFASMGTCQQSGGSTLNIFESNGSGLFQHNLKDLIFNGSSSANTWEFPQGYVYGWWGANPSGATMQNPGKICSNASPTKWTSNTATLASPAQNRLIYNGNALGEVCSGAVVGGVNNAEKLFNEFSCMLNHPELISKNVVNAWLAYATERGNSVGGDIATPAFAVAAGDFPPNVMGLWKDLGGGNYSVKSGTTTITFTYTP